MSEFDIDLDTSGLKDQLRELERAADGDPVYVVGTNVEYAVFLEFGTRHMPPYPFFRPAIREFRANPEQFIRDNTELGGVDEIDTVEELVQTVALSLERQMKQNATAASSDRSPGTDPEHPKVQTGNLRASIQAQRIR